MAISYAKLFSPTVLGTTVSTLYTVPSIPATNILRGGRIRFSNTTTAAVTVTAYAVNSGGSASAGNAFLTGYTVTSNSYIDVDLPLMAIGDTIQALSSSATSITAFAINGALFS